MVQGSGERRPKARKVGPAPVRVDVVREGEDVVLVRVGVLERDLNLVLRASVLLPQRTRCSKCVLWHSAIVIVNGWP